MIKHFLLAAAALLVVTGCGKVDQTADGSTYEVPTYQAYNCPYGTAQNGYGDCYGGNVDFEKNLVTDGIWSVYTQSNTKRTDGQVFYDRYQYGFDFFSDGSAGKQEKTDGYTLYREWGINDAGTSVTLSSEGAYTYVSTFSTDQNCFLVSNSSKTLKLCHESFVPQDLNNSAGYYGTNVKFGNRTDYNFDAVGTWSISGYGDNTALATTVLLGDNGTTSNGGDWGVSADGKVIGIDGVRYLVYQYLEPLSDQCIAVFELSGGVISSVKWKLCKQ